MSDLSPNISKRVNGRKAAIGGAAPPKDVALGQAAWERRKNDTATWNDWLLIGKALLVGRGEAESKAGKRSGKKYNESFHYWLEVNGFGDIDKADRSKLLRIMESLHEIEAWRAELTERDRANWNHPSSVWRAWTCKRGGNRGKSKAADGALVEVADDEDKTGINWQRNILLRARKSIGDAKLGGDRWLLSEPPEQGTIDTVRQAAQEWAGLAKFLQDELNKAS